MDQVKAYNRFDRRALWQVVSMHGVGGKLLRAMPSLYEDGMCIRWGRRKRVILSLRWI